MSSQIDFRILPINVPSLCIPRVFVNIDEKRIRRIFDELNMGDILRIDVVSKTTEKGEKFNRVFIHFKQWFSNKNSDTARERLLNGKEIKIIYDDPWFWKVSAYREQQASAARPEPRQQQSHSQKKPTILFDDEDDNKKSRNHYEDQRPRPRPGSSYDDDRRIKQHSQEHFQTTRAKPESGGFKKVSKSDSENRTKREEVPIRPIAPTLAPTIIAPALKVEVDPKAVEVKKEKDEEDEMMKQKVPPKKKIRVIAKKPLLKVEETNQDQVIIKEKPKEQQNHLEDGEIVEK